RQLAAIEIRCGLVAPQERSERGQAKRRAPRFRAELRKNQTESLPQVGVRRAAAPLREPSKPLSGIVSRVALSLHRAVRGDEQEVAVLGDEKEDEAVDGSEELSVVIQLVERSLAQLLDQPLVGRMFEEAATEGFDCSFDAGAERVES